MEPRQGLVRYFTDGRGSGSWRARGVPASGTRPGADRLQIPPRPADPDQPAHASASYHAAGRHAALLPPFHPPPRTARRVAAERLAAGAALAWRRGHDGRRPYRHRPAGLLARATTGVNNAGNGAAALGTNGGEGATARPAAAATAHGHLGTLVDPAFTKGAAAGSPGGLHARRRARALPGGAQDGVGVRPGGEVQVMKAQNARGKWVGGHVGKSFAYGAQRGLFLIQGDADARAGIRLSGADMVLGGEPAAPLNDRIGTLAARANCKGFAFEYMTGGRVVVLGDPGPWLCSGMTGGVVYVRQNPEWGLDEAAVRRRLSKAAKVSLAGLTRRRTSARSPAR